MDLDLEEITKDIAYVPTTGVRREHVAPLVVASNASLEGYGCLVDEPETFPIEIMRWPAQGWRPIDLNSGDQGGVTSGLFEFWWKGETLYARNNAVGDSYLFGWSNWPEEAATSGAGKPRERALIWRANYHPDGGQLFHPAEGPELRGASGAARRRCDAGEIRHLLVRRQARPLYPSQYLAWRHRAP